MIASDGSSSFKCEIEKLNQKFVFVRVRVGEIAPEIRIYSNSRACNRALNVGGRPRVGE